MVGSVCQQATWVNCHMEEACAGVVLMGRRKAFLEEAVGLLAKENIKATLLGEDKILCVVEERIYYIRGLAA